MCCISIAKSMEMGRFLGSKGQTQCQRLPYEWGLGKGITEAKSYPRRNSAERRLQTQDLVTWRASTHQLHQAYPSKIPRVEKKKAPALEKIYNLWNDQMFSSGSSRSVTCNSADPTHQHGSTKVLRVKSWTRKLEKEQRPRPRAV
jgi:hypothetical protein